MKKPLHVAYVLTKLELGGAQKVCLTLFEGIARNGINTVLFTGSDGALRTQVAEKPNVIFLDSFKREFSIRALWQELQTFFSLIYKLRALRKQHDTVIVHTHSSKAGIIGRWAALFAGIRYRVHTIHGYALHKHQAWHIWMAIYLAELFTSLITTHFICVSSEDVKIGMRLFPHFVRKHSIIRAAVNWQQFYIPSYHALPFPETGKPFVFGTISCFKPQKNLFDMLHAFALVHGHNPYTRLEIIGDGVLRPALEDWIHEHKLTHAIILHGWQSDVAPFMQQWHAFVLTSLWEGLPCAVVEARLLKLPVLAYNTGGIKDVICPYKNGFLYEQSNWHALADGMLALSKNATTLHSLQHHHDNLVSFHHENMIQNHMQLYQHLTSR